MASMITVASAACTLPWSLPGPGGDPSGPCGEPVIAVITFACVHEHVGTASACMGCAVDMQQIADVLTCEECEGGPEPHECPATLSIRWLV